MKTKKSTHFNTKNLGIVTLILISLLVSNTLFAQQFRYTSSIFNQIDTLQEVEYAQAEWLNNPISLFAQNNLLVHDGENITEKRPLLMDIFMPHSDTVKIRPAIIFLHSGAFLQGSRLNEDMVAMCDSFARKGYVTATIDYRQGMGASVNWLFGYPVSVKVNEINGYRAAYRGMQDTRAAIRFLKHNAEIYGIDTTKIYLTGSSAGGILALYNIYLDKNEINDFAYSSPSLGDIDTVGVQGYDSKAAAVTSLWGAVESPEIIGSNSTPVLLVHGTADKVVPFKKGVPLAALIPPEYKSFIQLNLPETFGSFCIDTFLSNQNITHETYFVEGQIHEFYGVETGKFKEDGPNAYWDTIQWKTTSFFFEQFKPEAEFDYQSNNLEFTFYDNTENSTYSLWDFGDGNFSEEKTAIHDYAVSGNYQVKLTTCNHNMACDTITKSVTAGTPDYAGNILQNEISIYPNPAKHLLNIKGIAEPYNVTIYDLTGRIKMIKNDVSGNTIDVSELQNGIYFIELSNSALKSLKR